MPCPTRAVRLARIGSHERFSGKDNTGVHGVVVNAGTPAGDSMDISVNMHLCETSETWLFLDSGPGRPAVNMAWDEALLDFVGAERTPVFRVYGWTEPAVTFGYFQSFELVRRITGCQHPVRRPTGGGIVRHGNDLTYALVLPAGHWWYRLRATESYRTLHKWIGKAISRLGLEPELAASRSDAGHTGECFVGHEQFDLVLAGKKIAGAAQRRTQAGLLIQGSIQLSEHERGANALTMVLLETGAEMFKVRWVQMRPGPELVERVNWLASNKYGTEAFNRKR